MKRRGMCLHGAGNCMEEDAGNVVEAVANEKSGKI